MNSIHVLVVRDEKKGGLDTTMLSLVVSLVVLIILGVVLIGALLFLRKMRRARKDAEAQLPLYEKRQSGHRRLTITTTPYGKGRDSVVVYQEKQDLMANSCSPPASPVPEIRITFPDEVDESGKRQSGRVVVVRVGEHSVGLEPLNEELPPYDRFDSLDLDRIGGLKEKNVKDQYC
ncbi:hypothetical protein CC80DRAFT_531878 [Byssothecium circinans]|uniref:Uncharacterized protein n=1 Tax=Byssothecium circinans TaxID=147558 RepID=A0A6A5UE31_9PLEO|nr:hypothetical protein CC80DRAFT_531878 [Byssothecium circinans]